MSTSDPNSSSFDENKSVYQSLQKLIEQVASLDQTTTTTPDQTQTPTISHYRNPLPIDLNHAYKLVDDGASLLAATSTKYTLMGKATGRNTHDFSGLALQLRQGCELLATGMHVIHTPTLGCSKSLLRHVLTHGRSVLTSVLNLVQTFETKEAYDANRGAEYTGRVWDACENLRLYLPRGNRAAMRRDVLTWGKDCQDTFQEFQEIIDAGAQAEVDEDGEAETNGDGGNDEDEWDDFCDGADQYSASELPVAIAAHRILKCSRGTLMVALHAMEAGGEAVLATNDEERQRIILAWIARLHALTTVVGEGVTELGFALYPPLDYPQLAEQLRAQTDAIRNTTTCILSAVDEDAQRTTDKPTDSSKEPEPTPLETLDVRLALHPTDVVEKAVTIRAASSARYDEAMAAFPKS